MTARLLRVAAVVSAGALPAIVMSGVIAGARAVAVSATVAVAAGLVVLVADPRRNRTREIVTAATIAGGAMVACLAAAVVADDESPRGAVSAAADALVHGWTELATSPVPADAGPRMLVPLTLVVWLATAGGAVLALRPTPGLRPLLPPAVAVVAACIAAGAHQRAPVAVGLALVGCGGLLLVAGRPTDGRRHLAAGATAAVAIGALVVGAAAGPVLAAGRDDDPFEPRDHWQVPTLPQDAASPLDLVAAWMQRPDDVLFTTESTNATPTRLAVFDTFDGARWTSSTSFRRAGRRIDPPRRDALASQNVGLEVSVTGLHGPWLPSVADPVGIDGHPVLIDDATGTIASADGDASGARYTLEAVVSDADVESLQTQQVDPSTGQMPPLPEELHQVATAAVAGATTPFAQAILLERYLRLSYQLDPSAPGGHSYGHLVRTLTVTHAGTGEQFATAFAVLGRSLGLPTRVVVGFGPGTESAPGTYAVRGADVRVWAEVRFSGAGWVAFDPTPSAGSDTGDGGLTVGVGGDDLVIQQGVAQPAGDHLDMTTDPTVPTPVDRPSASGGGATSDRIVRVAAGTVGVLVLLALAVVWRKAQVTRRRRRAPDPRDRVLGAWRDVLDRLAESGIAGAEQRTIGELVAGNDAAALTGMYRPVNRALYDDGDGDALGDGDAEQAWRCRDRFVESLRRRAPLPRRLRWRLDPRSLWGRRHRSRLPIVSTSDLRSTHP